MAILARVEDADGNAYGDGPVSGILSCRFTKSLDRAGAFTLEVPASAPRAILFQPRRYVRVVEVGDSAERLLGVFQYPMSRVVD